MMNCEMRERHGRSEIKVSGLNGTVNVELAGREIGFLSFGEVGGVNGVYSQYRYTVE